MKPLTLLSIFAASALAKSYHPKVKEDYDQNIKRSVRSSDGDAEYVEDMKFWDTYGSDEIAEAIKATAINDGIAKNVMIFVGDGMSIPTLTAARIYKQQKLYENYESAEVEYLTMERLNHMGHSKTFNSDYTTPDSASTASAMASGVKTKYYSAGFDSSIDNANATSTLDAQEVTTILDWAQEAGKATGLVTTARLTHATPMAFYAHVFDRDFECDTKYEDEETENENILGLKDIAWQLVNRAPGNRTNVLLGGGAPALGIDASSTFSSNEAYRQAKYDDTWECPRNDGRNLVEDWLALSRTEADGAPVFVHNETDLMAVNPEETNYLLGVFAESHLQWDHLRVPGQDPSLANMTQKAMEILSKNPSGFFMLVEGGRIDHAHHDVTVHRALDETVAMDLALETAIKFLEDIGELDQTLIVVTADHAHTMSVNGYSKRGLNILGLTGRNLNDDLPYTILSYANGGAYYYHNLPGEDEFGNATVVRRNLTEITEEELLAFTFEQTSAGYKSSETHGGDDVAIFAQGPMAHLFHTTHDQTHINNVMAYSACLGKYKDDNRCTSRRSGASSTLVGFQALTVLLTIFHVLPIFKSLLAFM